MSKRPIATLATALAAACMLAPASAAASEFRVVTDPSEFVELVSGRELRRFGIRLQVSPQGAIAGEGFGQRVSGDWRWDGRYFCRDLAYGSTELGHNCQLVAVRGDTIRFVADQGQGDYADFRLR